MIHRTSHHPFLEIASIFMLGLVLSACGVNSFPTSQPTNPNPLSPVSSATHVLSEATILPTLSAIPAQTPTAAPSPASQSFEQWLNTTDPRVSNPELFDAAHRGSRISQLISAAGMAGIELTAGQISQGLVIASKNEEGAPLIDVNGKEYAIMYFDLDPDPAKEGEGLEGRVALSVTVQDGNTWQWVPFTIHTIASLTRIRMGALTSGWRLEENALYRDTFLNNYSLLMAHGELMADTKENSFSNLDFSNSDAPLAFAEQQGLPGEFLHIVADEWKWYPKSARTEHFSAEQAEALLRAQVRTVIDRYQGSVSLWSVVNEAIDGDGKGGFTSNPWYDALGIDYIRVAFDEARKAAPEATLMYNDFDLEKDPAKRAQVRTFLQPLIDTGLVDAVGIQMHYFDTPQPASKAQLLEAMQEMNSWGVSVHITEFDTDMSNFSGTPEEKNLEQARIYRDMLSAFLESGVGASFTTFGFTDLTSSYGTDKSPEALAAAPLPFDSDLNSKAAYFGMLQAATEYLLSY